MPAHPLESGWPAGSTPDKSIIKQILKNRFVFILANGTEITTLLMADQDVVAIRGSGPAALTHFTYDATDTTTAHNGSSVLVSLDGRRYKVVNTGAGLVPGYDYAQNGSFELWSRTTTSLTASGVLCDRWRFVNGTGATSTISRAASTASTDGQYVVRWDRSVVGTTASTFRTTLENIYAWQNKTVTVSFDARATAGGTITVSGQVSSFNGAGGTAGSTATLVAISITGSSFARYSFTSICPAAGATVLAGSGMRVAIIRGTGQTNGQIDIDNIRIETGGSAGAYTLKPYPEDSDASDRTFQSYGGSAFYVVGTGVATDSSTLVVPFAFRTRMRAVPSFSVEGTFEARGSASITALTSVSASDLSDSGGSIVATKSGAFIAGQSYVLRASNDANARVVFDAEFL